MDQRTDQAAHLLPALRIVTGEVSRAGEQPAAVVHLSGTELAHILERAAHPIVLQGPQASPAPYASPAAGGPGHPGINIVYPAAGGYGYALPANVGALPAVPETRTWAPVAFVASAGALLAGPIVAMLAGSDLCAVVLCGAGFAGGVRSLVLLLRAQH